MYNLYNIVIIQYGFSIAPLSNDGLFSANPGTSITKSSPVTLRYTPFILYFCDKINTVLETIK